MNCPNCQSANPEKAKFCMNCGTVLHNKSITRPQETDKYASSQFLYQYLPQELIARLESARARDAMVGERRVITMLFCDVKGSTAAAEKVDPEIWTDIMNGVFEHMIRPIYKYEGLVPRLMGDAILAFFGAPIAHEDDPQRAVLAGLEIQQGIQSYAEEIRREHGLEFGLRVGINTGLVVVGEIGSDLRMEYTAIGDAINLAARMEQTAAVGTIQISAETYKLVAPFFEIEPLGEIEIKGKSAPVKTYRVLGKKAAPGHLRGLEGFSPRFVGREPQLVLINDRLKQLALGTGSIIGVVGELGLGKSTLILEVMKSDAEPRLVWLRGDALSYARSISYYLWRQIIRQSIDAHEDDSPVEVRLKLADRFNRCSVPVSEIPFLEAMLAVESENSLQVVAAVQGEALVKKIIDAVRGFLSGLAAEDPLVVVLDDLHWADEASLNLLVNLVNLAQTQPILFICMSRPDQTAPGWDVIQKIQQGMAEHYYPILLEPLRDEHTNLLLKNIFGLDDLPKNIRHLIVEKADGNPFFIEEIIRSLIETKQLVHTDTQWQGANAIARVSLPSTLRGVLSARIDRLPETTKVVLQNAAVIGRSFDLRVLKRLTSMNDALNAHIQYLQEVNLIEPLRNEYGFRHGLIQEAAYESILIKNRVKLHRQIGEILEELHKDRIEEFAPFLANHFYSANDERSLKYDILSGEKAARLYANAEAATHFSRALEAAKRHNKPSAQIIHLFTQLGHVLELSGRFEQALATYDEMQAFSREQGIRSSEMEALMAKATIYSIFSHLHNPALSAKMLEEALEISREIGDRTTQAKLNWNLMINYLFSKQLDQSLKHGEIALALARESDDREQLAFVLNDLCRLYACRGEFESAHTANHEARDLWISLDNQVMLADNFGSEASALIDAGRYAESLEYSQQALEISQKTENIWGQSYDLMLMSSAYFESGQLGRGFQVGERSSQLADEAGLIAGSISVRSELARMYAYSGAFETGFTKIEQALQVAEAKQPEWLSFPQSAKARMHLLMDDILLAEQSAGNKLFQPISIPFARYTIFVCLANIELAAAKKEFKKVLTLSDELLAEVMSLTRVDVPEVLRWKGNALYELHRLDEALMVLSQACNLARETGAYLHLWAILGDLAKVQVKLGKHQEAADNLAESRKIVLQVAESLLAVGLRDSFLNQPRVRQIVPV